MLEPKEILIHNKKYVITKFPAMQGVEIMRAYYFSTTSKDLSLSNEVTRKLLAYAGIPRDGGQPPLMLSNDALIENHAQDWSIVLKLQEEVLKYNEGFLSKESL
jgi:hypothetical protein